MRRFLALATLAAVLAALGAGVAFARHTKSVGMGDNYFFNATVRIKKGSAVHWQWSKTENVHNVVSKARGQRFHSKTGHSGSFTHVFTRRGTFTIICTKHPSVMRMKVKVV